MVIKNEIIDVLKTIPDPEMPISIFDLGLIDGVELHDADVQVSLLPTFIGCLALPSIAKEIKEKVGVMQGVQSVEVVFINDPPWNTDRITDDGRASLAAHGIAVPDGTSCGCISTQDEYEFRTSAIPCPWCQSSETTMTSPFGPTRCKSIHFCNACRQPFERMKKV
jgi:ring-1,2-phenylacetyl-CoA epoxidase subunit PaaD